MKNLIYFLKFQKKIRIFYIISLLFVGTFFDLFGLSLIIPLINSIADYDKLNSIILSYEILSPLKNLTQNELIITLLVLFLIINIFKGSIFVYLNWETNKFSKELNINISSRLINQYSKISYEEMINKSSSTLIRNLTEEIMSVSNAVLNFLNLIIELFVLLFIFVFILFVEPNGLLIITFFLLSGLYIFRKSVTKKLIFWGLNRQKYHLKKITNINELFHSYAELKILKKIKFYGKLYLEFNEKYFNNVIKYNIVQIVPRFLVESLAVLGLMFALIYLIVLKDTQTQILYSLGILGASALRLLPSMSRIINYYNGLKFSVASIDLIKFEIEGQSEVEKSNQLENKELIFKEKINLKNIYYTYPNKNLEIINNFNLEIKKGEIIGIKGSTGSGKSTLLKIILGLLKPKKGQILIDNNDIHEKNLLNSWYDKLSYVPQNVYLINESIKKNILLGIEENTEDKKIYNEVKKISLCDEFINKCSDFDNTLVGENGLKLSGGQKQRLGIARAVYQQKEILILDEATNSLDENTEKNILDNILKLKNKPTIIFVSHKSSNFNICDKIIDLKNVNS